MLRTKEKLGNARMRVNIYFAFSKSKYCYESTLFRSLPKKIRMQAMNDPKSRLSTQVEVFTRAAGADYLRTNELCTHGANRAFGH
jgi:hypothetical protein